VLYHSFELCSDISAEYKTSLTCLVLISAHGMYTLTAAIFSCILTPVSALFAFVIKWIYFLCVRYIGTGCTSVAQAQCGQSSCWPCKLHSLSWCLDVWRQSSVWTGILCAWEEFPTNSISGISYTILFIRHWWWINQLSFYCCEAEYEMNLHAARFAFSFHPSVLVSSVLNVVTLFVILWLQLQLH